MGQDDGTYANGASITVGMGTVTTGVIKEKLFKRRSTFKDQKQKDSIEKTHFKVYDCVGKARQIEI